MTHSLTQATRVFTLSDFDFQLPGELIAQHPTPERSGSRLLDGTAAAPQDRIFRELPALLLAGDLLVFNDTRVMNARLSARSPPAASSNFWLNACWAATRWPRTCA